MFALALIRLRLCEAHSSTDMSMNQHRFSIKPGRRWWDLNPRQRCPCKSQSGLISTEPPTHPLKMVTVSDFITMDILSQP
ncbi:hypothetical protein PoB_001613300 [Plakobranchus ocellatus]|uniref:Secreted protein n=1 Tax=Plakobranchus ocellatus TaxID=259542 RepID=A0AAV3Z4H5_9GAST|nr:hypothetical protein PoB_001613300 [Plakobranchus ocellatus]